MRKAIRLHPVVHAQGSVGGSTICGERGLAVYRMVFNFNMVTCKRCLKMLGKLTPIEQKREEIDNEFKASKRSGPQKFRPTQVHIAAALQAIDPEKMNAAIQKAVDGVTKRESKRLREQMGDSLIYRSESAILISDYEEALADKRRLTRELDVAMHGEEGAAKQASLCDLIEPARRLRNVLLLADELCKAMRVYDSAVEDHRAASVIFKDLSQAVDKAMYRTKQST